MAGRLYVVAKIPKTVYDGRVRIFKLLSIFVFALLTFFIFTKNAFATITATLTPSVIYQDSTGVTITLTSDVPDTFKIGKNYMFGFWKSGSNPDNATFQIVTADNGSILKTALQGSKDTVITLRPSQGPVAQGLWIYKVWKGQSLRDLKEANMVFPAGNTSDTEGKYYVYPPVGSGNVLGLPSLEINSPVQVDKDTYLTVVNVNYAQDYTIYFADSKITNILSGKFPQSSRITLERFGIDGEKRLFPSASILINSDKNGSQRICMNPGKNSRSCEYWVSFYVQPTPAEPPCDVATPIRNLACGWAGSTLLPGVPDPNSIPSDSSPAYNNTRFPCSEFTADGKTCIAVNTAIGNISTEPQGFVRRIFELVLGLSGGIALILIIISGYKFMVSQGNPEALKAATEQLTSAIVGLLFIILSFVILQIIGVDILQIPGFGP